MHRFSLIAELDRKRQITSRLAACFKDYRNPNKILHPVNSLIAQRIYGLIMGYEDINDHENLRHDPIFALAVGKVINSEHESITLAGKSTLNRLEHCPDNVKTDIQLSKNELLSSVNKLLNQLSIYI